jgi:hypothetical protein
MRNYLKNAAVWFKKIYNVNYLTAKYIHVHVNGNNPQSTNKNLAAIRYIFGQELKFLYRKKLNLG